VEVRYLLYLASVGLPSGYVAIALQPVEVSRLTAEAPPLTSAQQAELRARLDAYANNPQDRRTWEEVADSFSRKHHESLGE
jgi:putative addiction module component (TIGR02574 family)